MSLFADAALGLGHLFWRSAGRLVFLLAVVPVAITFAAYLAGIVVMCTRELWRTWKNDRKGEVRHEEADPRL